MSWEKLSDKTKALLRAYASDRTRENAERCLHECDVHQDAQVVASLRAVHETYRAKIEADRAHKVATRAYADMVIRKYEVAERVTEETIAKSEAGVAASAMPPWAIHRFNSSSGGFIPLLERDRSISDRIALRIAEFATLDDAKKHAKSLWPQTWDDERYTQFCVAPPRTRRAGE